MRPFTRVAVTALYFLLCCYLFFLPGNELPQEDWLDRIYFDKWVHVGLFVVLTLLLGWSGFAQGRRQWLWIALVCVAFGLSVEIIQGLWVVNRSADVLDFVSDSFGVGAGLLLRQRWGKKNKPL